MSQEIYTWQTSALCGDPYEYTPCTPCNGAESIVVVYPALTSPHDVVAYGSYCFSRAGDRLDGTLAQSFIDACDAIIIPSGSVVAVLDCTDVICTGSVVGGESIRYTDTQTHVAVHVKFDGLTIGDPYTAAAPQVVDTGLTRLPTLRVTLTFNVPRVLLTTVSSSGLLEIDTTGLAGISSKIVIVRNGQNIFFAVLPVQNTRVVQVEPGDAIYIDVGNRAGLLDDKTRRRRAVISCRPVVPLPRKYDEVLLSITGSGSIRSLGFTGLTNRSPYALFDSLPWDGTQEFPNPDNVVTVQDSGSSEFVLIRTRAIGDPVPALPGNTEWYGGQVLNGSLTFRFYTSREEQGAHGEMDLWRTNPVSSFPTYFGAGPYRALQLCSPMSHVASAVGDTSRNSLRAIADLAATTGRASTWPGAGSASSPRRSSGRFSGTTKFLSRSGRTAASPNRSCLQMR
jgi:hypothetical protein